MIREKFIQVLQYLKAHLGKGILFKKTSNIALAIYTDADFAGSPLDRWSTTGYCTFLRGNLVSWRSKKQNLVYWPLLILTGCSPERFDNFSLLGKALVLAKNGREFGWRILFVYSRRCGWKGIGWLSRMRPPLLTG